jgi:hypothetical protein
MTVPENSEHFLDAFCSVMGGSPVVTCHCGIVVYCDSEHYNEGEFEGLEAQSKLFPGGFHFQGYDSVGHRQIAGKTYVEGCPCKALEKLEAFLWSERDSISRYIYDRARAEAHELDLISNRLREGSDVTE